MDHSDIIEKALEHPGLSFVLSYILNGGSDPLYIQYSLESILLSARDIVRRQTLEEKELCQGYTE